MIRLLLWLFAGVILGGVIHIAVILLMPIVSANDLWTRVASLDALDQIVVLPPTKAGEPNPLHLDPEVSYAVCQIDLSKGPGEVSGALPQAFWSIAVYNRAGTVLYSTTNRAGSGEQLDLGIFNPAQTRLLAQQELDIAEGLLIVESPEDDVFAVVKLAPRYEVMRPRYEAALSDLICGNIGI